MNKFFEIGIDEVGRGAVFGPVFSAAIVITKQNGLALKKLGVIDSKQLTPKKRAFLVPHIIKLSSDYGIGQSSVKEIDKFGIRIENLVYVKKNKFEELTIAPIEKDLINKKFLNKKEVKWFNKYHEKVKRSLFKFMNFQEKRELTKACSPI
mgnify:CR=1 FL=1